MVKLVLALAVAAAVVFVVPKESLPDPVRRLTCAVWSPHCKNAELLAAVTSDNVAEVKRLLAAGVVNLNARGEVRLCALCGELVWCL